jgi:hypothetical protein
VVDIRQRLSEPPLPAVLHEESERRLVPLILFRQLGPPREVFSGDYGSSTPIDSWDLGPDGRFIMYQSVPRPDAPPITRISVVLNWFAELNRLAPVKK